MASAFARLAAVVAALVVLAAGAALASDPGPLQDFCVGDKASTVFVNGFVCKDPKKVTPEDFFYTGLDVPRTNYNRLGVNVTVADAAAFPGLNTLGFAFGRIDYAPYGIVQPHTHPRATEVLTVLYGELLAGFVTGSPDNKLYAKRLRAGDVYIFPQGLTHFQVNVCKGRAAALVGFGGQNPGFVTDAYNLFRSEPVISGDVLARVFGIDEDVVEQIREKVEDLLIK